ncbi:MAG: bifunctional UDP-N-acetylglucosamine diphosphorylase/glucosamine-1-phosphate N-acetyltransferase GlmU [Campylobacterales bacterium]
MVEIVVLAGGKGTRMHSSIPKVLHPICGKPILHWILEEALKVTEKVHLVLGHSIDKVREQVAQFPVQIWEQDLIRYPGSGGALRAAMEGIEGNQILVLNGDTPLITATDLKPFLEVKGEIVVGVTTLPDPTGYGRVIETPDGEILKIVEEKDATPEEKRITKVNTGVYRLSKRVIERYLDRLDNRNAQRELYLTQLVQLATGDRLQVVAVEVDPVHFKGVNNKRQLAEAEEIKCREIKNRWMEMGVVMHLPETIYIDAYTSFEGESEIEPGVVLKGSRIVRSKIKANSVIEGGEIVDSEIGPMARIRPKTQIFRSRIGNFVEVKASQLEGVKAGHLSYLGDAEIGEGTNIGAGTITCNYDGTQKYKTKIGREVFIGSGTKLIAPIELEDQTMTGAGSVVNRNLPKGSLGIARPPLKIIPNFFYRFFNKK